MKTPPILTDSQPPKLLPTIFAGFNTVASNISLIILPLLLDFVLWLGPKLKVESLFLPQIKGMASALTQLNGADMQTALKSAQTMWTQFLSQFNLGVAVRTIPIGIPSLVAREMLFNSPLKNVLQYQIPTVGLAFLILLGLLTIGFFLGNFYFSSLSRITANPTEKLDFKKLMFQFGQSIVMALIMLVIVMIIAIPGMMLLSMIALVSGQIADFLILVALFVMLWLALPLVFSPHGVYVINQKAFPSMLLSIRMIRFSLPGASMFVITSALISECLNLVWSIPDASSWLTAIGIFGHAFVVTALLTASFIYYRNGLRWMQENSQRMSAAMSKPENGGPFGTTRK
jgi:hypothetical protein